MKLSKATEYKPKLNLCNKKQTKINKVLLERNWLIIFGFFKITKFTQAIPVLNCCAQQLFYCVKHMLLFVRDCNDQRKQIQILKKTAVVKQIKSLLFCVLEVEPHW